MVADSGAAGLAMLERASDSGQPFGLILLDEQMPSMDGIQVIERIRRNPALPDATIMMLTSSDQTSSAARCRQMGVPSYLIKPIKPADLLLAIRKTMGMSRDATGRKNGTRLLESAGFALEILLAEDNFVNKRLAVALLEKMGHRVTAADNGSEACERWREGGFDLILMDVQMPVMDGFVATAHIRQMEKANGARIPIIAMTAHAMSGDRERCIAIGMDDYVSKPISRASLEQVLSRYANAAKPVRSELETRSIS
jgi:CheY-like chemotaxis protein